MYVVASATAEERLKSNPSFPAYGNLTCLARSANLPEGLYILPSVSFFFYISFLMISRRQIISRST